MSHFSVVVCIHDISELEKALAPFDENMEVEQYKDYEAKPEDHWAVSLLRQEGLLPAEGELTAEQVAVAHSTKYPPDPEDDGTDEGLHWDEKGLYTISTRNPLSKWDWYEVGGRWSDYFKANNDGLIASDELIIGRRSWGLDGVPKKQGYCDGGPKRLLDLAGMRREAGEKAGRDYDAFHKMAGDLLSSTTMWPVFVEKFKAQELTIEQAREQFHAQPLLQRMRTLDEYRWDGAELLGLFSKPRSLVVVNAEAAAVPGYAVLKLDGTWSSPGEMGWFGMSTDTESDLIGYREAMNAYIESLDGDVLLVAVDCHI